MDKIAAIEGPDHTAVRVALWRALHVELDASPHVFNDEIGAKIVGDADWRNRPDMNPEFSKAMRASIVGRARFIEDLVEERKKQGVTQYVILGAGLDTFAQRRPDVASQLQVFEVDQVGPQAWKRKRYAELGFAIPEWLHFVPVDFEAKQSWWEHLTAAGFNPKKSAIVVSTGVSMYLTRDANMATLQQLARLAPGSTFAMTFLLSLNLLDGEERSMLEFVMRKAQEAGTPFLSLFSPTDIVAMAQEAGFQKVQHVSAGDLYQRYFAHRKDKLRAGNAEGFLVAMT
jgi:methyltransferase (TIGR00027 family)